MPDPVQQVASSAAEAVKNAGGGFLSKILSPVIGLGKGIFGSLTNIGGLLMSSLGIFAVGQYTPHAVAWALSKFNGKPVEEIEEDLKKGGTGAMIKYALIGGAATNAAIGGVKGMVSEVTGSVQEESSTLGKVVGFAGGALAIAGVATVAMGAVHRSGVKFDGNADKTSSKEPTNVPNNAENSADKAKGA